MPNNIKNILSITNHFKWMINSKNKCNGLTKYKAAICQKKKREIHEEVIHGEQTDLQDFNNLPLANIHSKVWIIRESLELSSHKILRITSVATRSMLYLAQREARTKLLLFAITIEDQLLNPLE